MPKLDTHNIEAVAGAIYFVVGLATEGGANSYRLSVAGIPSGTADPRWGKVEMIKADSGYSLGAIQVDLGKRGTWALGSTNGAGLRLGEQSYVDAIIDEAAKFANENHLDFTKDVSQLRANLLTHGNGQDGRSALVFLEPDTYNTINAWASSERGKPWIHKNIDYPQIKRATQTAMDLLDKFGKNVSEDRRLEAIAILAKTANQMPSRLKGFEKVLKDGGGYDDLLAEARKISGRYGYYAGPKAADSAAKYQGARTDRETAKALDRAQAKVASADFDPSVEDPDIQTALAVIGRGRPAHVLRQGSRGDEVAALQTELARLGVTDAGGVALRSDGVFGPGTRAAVETFQRAHGLESDGLAGPETMRTLHEAVRRQAASLADAGHPGYPLFCQALGQVHALDARYGRVPDTFSVNLAGSLATAARTQGLVRIDHVVLGEGSTHAFAVQGDPRSPLRQLACVDVMQAIARPLAQSSAEFLAASGPEVTQQAQGIQPQPRSVPLPIEGVQR